MIQATTPVFAKSLEMFIIGAVVTGVLSLISYFAAQESKKYEGMRSVAYPVALLAFVIIGWLIVGGIAAWLLWIEQGMNAVLAMAFAAVILVPLTMESLMFRITWDDNFMLSKSPWRKKKIVPLSTVKSWDHDDMMHMYCIHTRFDGKIHVSQFARNVEDLLDAIDESA